MTYLTINSSWWHHVTYVTMYLCIPPSCTVRPMSLCGTIYEVNMKRKKVGHVICFTPNAQCFCQSRAHMGPKWEC